MFLAVGLFRTRIEDSWLLIVQLIIETKVPFFVKFFLI